MSLNSLNRQLSDAVEEKTLKRSREIKEESEEVETNSLLSTVTMKQLATLRQSRLSRVVWNVSQNMTQWICREECSTLFGNDVRRLCARTKKLSFAIALGLFEAFLGEQQNKSFKRNHLLMIFTGNQTIANELFSQLSSGGSFDLTKHQSITVQFIAKDTDVISQQRVDGSQHSVLILSPNGLKGDSAKATLSQLNETIHSFLLVEPDESTVQSTVESLGQIEHLRMNCLIVGRDAKEFMLCQREETSQMTTTQHRDSSSPNNNHSEKKRIYFMTVDGPFKFASFKSLLESAETRGMATVVPCVTREVCDFLETALMALNLPNSIRHFRSSEEEQRIRSGDVLLCTVRNVTTAIFNRSEETKLLFIFPDIPLPLLTKTCSEFLNLCQSSVQMVLLLSSSHSDMSQNLFHQTSSTVDWREYSHPSKTHSLLTDRSLQQLVQTHYHVNRLASEGFRSLVQFYTKSDYPCYKAMSSQYDSLRSLARFFGFNSIPILSI